jgi:hypothetical protein
MCELKRATFFSPLNDKVSSFSSFHVPSSDLPFVSRAKTLVQHYKQTAPDLLSHLGDN